ncbi:hypothetical protein P280DRAFT_511720 [Massarina eburnea CBS 473.64]|uniref:Uncharacterized protein n=1 Tax=Massarina eburnea CBS 473.64 TaxID=1395130 RepID=A0A6A6RL45_9PLEO|nr:hypothetical protein P280DRAFT_511720 [Massarina eburnea CBS 473.64]
MEEAAYDTFTADITQPTTATIDSKMTADITKPAAAMGDSKTTADTEVAKVIELHNQIVLLPPQSIFIRCDSMISIQTNDGRGIYEQMLIAAKTPLLIVASGRGLVCSTTQDLGPKFAAGWNKMPDELKLRILGFALIKEEDINYDHGANVPLGWARFKRTLLYKFLKSTPDIARLTTEAYYSNNSVQLHIHMGRDYSYTFSYPKAGRFIRVLYIKC